MLQVGKLAMVLLVPLFLITILVVLLLGSRFVGTQQSTSVAQAALALQDHLFGTHANQYNASDPFMQPIISYWRSYCRNADGSLCSLAQSGNLQGVEFVAAAQWLAGDPLPKIDDAINFWTDYAQQPGWAEIPPPSEYPNLPFEPPNVGDLMIWRNAGNITVRRWVKLGVLEAVVLPHLRTRQVYRIKGETLNTLLGQTSVHIVESER